MGGGHDRGIQLLRTLYREMRPSVQEPHRHVYQTQAWKYVMQQCRACPQQGEESSWLLLRIGEYYVDALQGTREHQRLHDLYKGKGERSAKDMADILGFKMPIPGDSKPDRRPRPRKGVEDKS